MIALAYSSLTVGDTGEDPTKEHTPNCTYELLAIDFSDSSPSY